LQKQHKLSTRWTRQQRLQPLLAAAAVAVVLLLAPVLLPLL
jgi:hypothetical protein